MESVTGSPSGPFSALRLLRTHWLASALVVVAGVLLYWDVLRNLVAYWLEDPDFSHGFAVPGIAGLVLYASRAAYRDLEPRMWLPGLAVVLASLLVYFLGRMTLTNTFLRLSMWGVFLGSVLFLLGPAFVRAKPFPIFFVLLAIPPPFFILNELRLALKGVATRLAADTLRLGGLPAYPLGNVIVVGEHRLEVADACSGIRSLMAITTVAILMAYLLGSGVTRGALLTASAVPVTIVANVARVVLVAVALQVFGLDWAHGTPHLILGLAVFSLSVVALLGLDTLYRWLFEWNPRGGSS